MKFLTETNLLIFLLQFALLLGLSKLLGQVFVRYKQSPMIAEILVGLLLGPVIFGGIYPTGYKLLFPVDQIQTTMLETIAWFGNFFLLLETGMGVNISRIIKQKGPAVIIAVTDIALPMLLAFVPMYLLPDVFLPDPSRRFTFALFLSVVMTISALPVAIRVMHDLKMLTSDMGFLVVSALTVNDLLGWVLLTIVMSIYSQSGLPLAPIITTIGLTLAFTVLSFTVIRFVVDKTMTYIHKNYGAETGLKTSFIFIFGMLMGAFTSSIGIHTLFGFSIAGIIIGSTRDLSEKDRHLISRLVHYIFIPIFFANVGLHLDFIHDMNIGLVLLFTFLGIAVRYSGAYLGGIIARQDRYNLSPIAICHTAGGEMHIVVAILAYSSGFITKPVFVALIAAALISTLVFGPWLTFVLNRTKNGLLNILFSRDALLLNYGAEDKQSLFSGISNLMAHKTTIPTEVILSSLEQREASQTTAVGNGIAFPHARLEGLRHPVIYYVRNKKGLEWDSPDGKPVHYFFFIFTPSTHDRMQIYILQALSGALSKPEVRHEIFTQKDTDVLWQLLRSEIVQCEKCLTVNT